MANTMSNPVGEDTASDVTTEEVIQRAIEQWAVLAFGAEPTEYPSLAHYIAASLKEAR